MELRSRGEARGFEARVKGKVDSLCVWCGV